MVKIFLFIAGVFFVMLYPVILGNQKYFSYKTYKNKNVPKVKFIKGHFFIYEKKLAKKGSFKTLSMFQNEYVAKNLKISDLINQEKYEAKKTVFKNDIITGFDVKYQNKDMKLITKRAEYDKSTKILTGGKFQLYAQDFQGYGSHFEIDDKKDIYAQHIIYYLKVDK